VVSVPVFTTGDRWEWQPHHELNPAGHEFVYSDDELRATFRTYGRMVALILRNNYNRFTISAYGMVSGNLLGRDQWEWCRTRRGYFAHGEPWALFAVQARVPKDMGPKLPR
jgi:hypothetical protein